MQTDEDMLETIIPAFTQMENEGVAFYRLGKPNLAELSRRTGITARVLKRLYDNGFKAKAHGNTGRVREHVISGDTETQARLLLESGITNSSVINDKLAEIGYTGSLTSVKTYISSHKDLVPAKRSLAEAPIGKIRRYSSGSGEMYQMDWGFVKVSDECGELWQCACFAMVCHHCGKRYIEFFPNARQESLFIGMLHSFAYLGVPETVLTDNMASVSNRRDSNGLPIFNKEYDEFQKLIGIKTKLCKVRHPWTKGSVERLVRFVKDNFIQGRKFVNVTDLNEKALSWCNHENSILQKGLGVIPAVEHDKETLMALPESISLIPYMAPVRLIANDGFVFYEGRRYGVPLSYSKKKARVMRAADKLYILDCDEFATIETHDVDWSYKPHYSSRQFEPEQPEELPTEAVTAVIEMNSNKADFDFSCYDF